ncbi:MAG: uridylate kinase [Pseudomonadota bacterium]
MTIRTTLLTTLAGAIDRIRQDWPLRIAVDGRTASGKTTLADALAVALRERRPEVIRSSIDGFHRPRAQRYARGRYSAEGYYHDARDLDAVMALLLTPLGPGGDRVYRTASFDLAADRPITQPPQTARPDAILIVDGTFLQRPELRRGWDLTIFIDTSEAIAERRGIARDAASAGDSDAVRSLYASRYRPAYDLYAEQSAPAASADVVIGNDDFDQPTMRLRPGGRLSEPMPHVPGIAGS